MSSTPRAGAAPPAPDHPASVPVAHTLEWLDRAAPELASANAGLRVLEVGCGRGALAAALLGRGVDLTAIDADPEVVAAARARGVPALDADLMSFDARPFEAVLFTRSLHHLGELAPALARAHGLLVPGGTLVVEEFAFERADTTTAGWFYAQRTRLALEARLVEPDGEDADDTLGPLERWREHHVNHDVHSGAAMKVALRERFDPAREEEEAPYLYRWFADRVTPDASGAREVAALLEQERAGIATGLLGALGMRLVMRSRT